MSKKDYLKDEIQWFNEHLQELLKEHAGEWAVVYQRALVGTYETFSGAYKSGIEKTKSEEFLVREIKPDDDKPQQVSVNISLGLIDADFNRP